MQYFLHNNRTARVSTSIIILLIFFVCLRSDTATRRMRAGDCQMFCRAHR